MRRRDSRSCLFTLACLLALAGCGGDREGLPAPDADGAVITYFGLTRADGTVIPVTEQGPGQAPIFVRVGSGTGFGLVVEGRPGPLGSPVGLSAFRDGLDDYPDLQILADRPLGDGSPAVCDTLAPAGGVPAGDPPGFDGSEASIAIVNDLSCRFRDGAGRPAGVGPEDACTLFPSGDYRFVDAASTTQFCANVARSLSFPEGDTRLTVRLRDEEGRVGPARSLIVRVLPPPSPAPSPSPLPSPTPVLEVGPEITFLGVIRADDSLVDPFDEAEDGTPIYLRRSGAGFSLVIEARPGSAGVDVGLSTLADLPGELPDLQIVANQNLGDGSLAVCDRGGEGTGGGVPAVDPPVFDGAEDVVAAINDLACRFRSGADEPLGRGPEEACVLFPSGDYRFVSPLSTVQYCAAVDTRLAFPVGDTRLTVRARDAAGNVGAPRAMIVRVF